MKIYLGTDHAGFNLKEKIKAFLIEKKYEVEDCGAFSLEPQDDYPDYIKLVAQKISQNPAERGIIFGGSGQAEAMVANKYPGVRATVFYGPVVAKEAIDVNGEDAQDGYDLIRLSRVHNDANILSLGARFVTEEQAVHAVTIWLTTAFGNDPRHVRRIKKIQEIEKEIKDLTPNPLLKGEGDQ